MEFYVAVSKLSLLSQRLRSRSISRSNAPNYVALRIQDKVGKKKTACCFALTNGSVSKTIIDNVSGPNMRIYSQVTYAYIFYNRIELDALCILQYSDATGSVKIVRFCPLAWLSFSRTRCCACC